MTIRKRVWLDQLFFPIAVFVLTLKQETATRVNPWLRFLGFDLCDQVWATVLQQLFSIQIFRDLDAYSCTFWGMVQCSVVILSEIFVNASGRDFSVIFNEPEMSGRHVMWLGLPSWVHARHYHQKQSLLGTGTIDSRFQNTGFSALFAWG